MKLIIDTLKKLCSEVELKEGNISIEWEEYSQFQEIRWRGSDYSKGKVANEAEYYHACFSLPNGSSYLMGLKAVEGVEKKLGYSSLQEMPESYCMSRVSGSGIDISFSSSLLLALLEKIEVAKPSVLGSSLFAKQPGNMSKEVDTKDMKADTKDMKADTKAKIK